MAKKKLIELKPKTIAFGVIWALAAVYVGDSVIKVIDFIEMLADALLVILKFMILFPAKVAEFFGFAGNTTFEIIIALIVGIVFANIAKKVFKAIGELFEATPI